jgi:hypothetical protein
MEVKKERFIAYVIMIVLFVVGVVCYAAFPEKAPEEPIRIMFKGTAGNVLFDHKLHASEDGYALECTDCHHDLEDEGERPSSCSECHEADSEDEDAVKRLDAFHTQCIGCHEDDGTAPAECSGCHAF